ncbi:NAD(P)H-binding protein [Devosia riboflavina]
MTNSSELFLITGATGKLGRVLTPKLIAEGHRIRVLTRRPETARELYGDKVEISEGDFSVPASLPAALDGVSKVLLLSPISERLAEDQIALVDAAKAAGVKRIVKISGSDWTVGTSFSGDAHKKIEDHLAQSGLEYVAVRPNAWLQVSLAAVAAQIKRGEAIASRHGGAKVGYVDVRDIADVAISQLLAPKVAASPLVITGPDSLSIPDIAGLATRITGKPVGVSSAVAAGLPPGIEGFEAQVVKQFFVVIGQGGAAGLTDTVERVLERKPRSVEAYLSEELGAA